MHHHTFVVAAGGTGGSVSPLLALLEAFPDAHVVWVGTRHWKQEQEMMKGRSKSTRGRSAFGGKAEFRKIFSGKLRRYWDWRNLTDPVLVVLGFFQSLWILARARPCAALTAGSYVAVPVAWAAWVLRIPVIAYQQDVEIGLANRFIARVASLILCVREEDAQKFNPKKLSVVSCQLSAHAVGSLIRSDRLNGDADRVRAHFSLEKGIPTLLVIGGGTGSQFLNQLISDNLAHLCQFCKVIHVTGSQNRTRNPQSSILNPRYHPVAFLGPELADAYAVADLVITRAGMGVLTELAANKKAAIVIPLPESHQDSNAALLESHDAAIVRSQGHPELAEGSRFVSTVQSLLGDDSRRTHLASNLHALFPTANKKEVADLIAGHCHCERDRG